MCFSDKDMMSQSFLASFRESYSEATKRPLTFQVTNDIGIKVAKDEVGIDEGPEMCEAPGEDEESEFGMKGGRLPQREAAGTVIGCPRSP